MYVDVHFSRFLCINLNKFHSEEYYVKIYKNWN